MTSHAGPLDHIPNPEELQSLPPDGGEKWNRLVFEQSPYLLQHAANPVDWYPWGEEAFAAASAADKPVFLSVGYATCHWCHVMERESFENPEIAQLINEAFVPVKVDREERPDIDQAYMTVTQALTGHGGWPMTVVLTPDKKPFFAGTYFPPEGKFGRPGIRQVIDHLSSIWREDREKALSAGDTIVAELQKMTSAQPGDLPNADTMKEQYEALRSRFEHGSGGFSVRPKFPVPHNLMFLLRYAMRTGEQDALMMAVKTLRHMRLGGVYDHVGFGIHRYATDTDWLVPHFEKMLYDQALTALAAIECYQVTRDPFFQEFAEEIFTYVARDMTDAEGGFYSAEDADSEGEEGKFYVWSCDEIRAALEDDADFFMEVFNFEEQGNFHEESTGQRLGVNIPHLTKPLSEIAKAKSIESTVLKAKIEGLRVKLFNLREQRIHPLKDDKILTDWNGLMIAAFATGAMAFDRQDYREIAQRAADYALTSLRRSDGKLHKRSRKGVAGLPAHLEDYAYLSYGLIELYQASFEERYLLAAKDFLDILLTDFQDQEHGGFYQSASDGESMIYRSKENYDGATPSGNSVATLALIKMARMIGMAHYEEAAVKALKAFASPVSRAPGNFSFYSLAVELLIGESAEVVLAGEVTDPLFKEMEAVIRENYLPSVTVVHRPNADNNLVAQSDFLNAMKAQNGKATAFVCRNFVCEQPVNSAEELKAKVIS